MIWKRQDCEHTPNLPKGVSDKETFDLELDAEHNSLLLFSLPQVSHISISGAQAHQSGLVTPTSKLEQLSIGAWGIKYQLKKVGSLKH